MRYSYADIEEEEEDDEVRVVDPQTEDEVKVVKTKPRKPAKREKQKPEFPYQEVFVKKWLKNPLFDERDTYGKMSGHM